MKNDLKLIEMGLIGAAVDPITSVRTKVLCEERGVTSAFFSAPEAKRVWELIERQWKDTGHVDETLVHQDAQADAAFVTKCVDNMLTTFAIAEGVDRLVSRYWKRYAINIGHQLVNDAHELDAPDAIAKVENAITEYYSSAKAVMNDATNAQTLIEQICNDYALLHEERRVKGNADFYIGLPLPWGVLNKFYNGVKPGLHIIAARPSQGKTAISVTMSAGLALKCIKQLFFSLDMHEKEFVKRYGSLLSEVPLTYLESGGTEEELTRFKKGLLAWKNNGKIVISTRSHIDRMIAEMCRYVKREGVQAIWIDYLQEINAGLPRSNQKEQIDAVLQKLKQAALTLGVPIFLLCQLNRESAKEDREPNLADLGDSGRIERDASTVLALWTDPQVRDAWDKTPPRHLTGGDPNLTRQFEPKWLLLLKNQQGPTGKLPFVMIKPTFTFRPADHEAKPLEIPTEKGHARKDRTPFFARLRDDFLTLRQDKPTQQKRTIGKR